VKVTDIETVSVPRVGIDAYSLIAQPMPPSNRSICERDVFAMLRAVKELGGDGLQASLPDDPGQIDAAFDLAGELDLYLEPYVPLPADFRGDAARVAQKGEKCQAVLRAAAERGIGALHCTLGARERIESYPRWREYVGEVGRVLERLAPQLRECGIRLGIENHWDFTTYEIIGLAEQVGPDVVGCGLDTGNLPILGEAMDRGVERAAPYTVTSHLKDVYLISTPTGASRPIVGLGEGQVGMAEAVRRLAKHNPRLNFTIEDHPVIYPIDYFEPWWLDAVPELTTHDVAAMARYAREGDRMVREHLVADPHAAELVPWATRGPIRLRQDIVNVKRWLAEGAAERNFANAAAPVA
jgi:sugar phosphate isomerase/epimerase